MTTERYRKKPVHRGVTDGVQIGVRLTKDQHRKALAMSRHHPAGIAGLLRDLLAAACDASGAGRSAGGNG